MSSDALARADAVARSEAAPRREDAPAAPDSDRLPRGYVPATAKAIAERSGDPDWLGDLRMKALEAAAALPMPLGRPHTEIRPAQLFDDLAFFGEERRGPTSVGTPAPLAGLDPELVGTVADRPNLVVRRDARVVCAQLAPEWAAKGVIFTDLHTAAREHPDLVRPLLEESAAAGEHRLAALAAALWTGGTLLYVPRNVEVTDLLWTHTVRDTAGLALFPRTIVVAERHSKVELFETHFSRDPDDFGQHDGLVEVYLGDGAQVTYAGTQHLGRRLQHVMVQRSHGSRDSTMTWANVILGGRLAKLECESWLMDRGASTYTLGLYYATGAQHFDLGTLADHQVGDTRNDTLYKGVLTGRARTEYRGLIRMHKDAQRSDSYLADHNLLLSGDARADAIPGLEIEANDVRCTHGATIGHVNPDQLFYLMSRGISREDGMRMLVDGFFEPVLMRVANASIRAAMRGFLHKKLHA